MAVPVARNEGRGYDVTRGTELGSSVDGSVGHMTTGPSTEDTLRVRLWIGRNPLAFVAACLVLGYWLGMSSVRSSWRES